jgi:hypothetical protein
MVLIKHNKLLCWWWGINTSKHIQTQWDVHGENHKVCCDRKIIMGMLHTAKHFSPVYRLQVEGNAWKFMYRIPITLLIQLMSFVMTRHYLRALYMKTKGRFRVYPGAPLDGFCQRYKPHGSTDIPYSGLKFRCYKMKIKNTLHEDKNISRECAWATALSRG